MWRVGVLLFSGGRRSGREFINRTNDSIDKGTAIVAEVFRKSQENCVRHFVQVV